MYLSWIFTASLLTLTSSARQEDSLTATATCSAGAQACGPTSSCCTPGLQCSFRRAVPVCVNTSLTYTFGYNHDPCEDPYLFRCDDSLGIPGFCCPIGTLCYTDSTNKKLIRCIDALGTTASAFPTATRGAVPSSSPILGKDMNTSYHPGSAWNVTKSDHNCTTNSLLHVTDKINASASFNYTGPSVMIHVVTSSTGGVFSVLIDGFNTTSTVDTFSGQDETSLPTCYPLQFPPIAVTPPGYSLRSNHNISLIHLGPSPAAPEGTNVSHFQFDSFAVPDLASPLIPTSGDSKTKHSVFYLLWFPFGIFLYLR